jgi:hypothetical protein
MTGFINTLYNQLAFNKQYGAIADLHKLRFSATHALGFSVFTSCILVKKKSCPCAKRIKHYAMKAYGGVDVEIHIFLTSALAGGEW